MRVVQKKKRVAGKNQAQKMKHDKAVKQAHQELITLSQQFLNKSEETLNQINCCSLGTVDVALIADIQGFSKHTERQIEQIERRVLQGEAIPHDEKVFSLFQPHTEWISKGKAGVPVELGLRVCVMEEQHQFILHHKVMQRETDDQVAILMVDETKQQFPNLSSCSFDKGFHSPENQKVLSEYLDVVALRRKGKLSQKAKAIETSEAFKKAHNKHSAVESAINALEVHGLDKCRDHGIKGFKRYVALAVVTRNIHRIGDILHQKAQKRLHQQLLVFFDFGFTYICRVAYRHGFYTGQVIGNTYHINYHGNQIGLTPYRVLMRNNYYLE